MRAFAIPLALLLVSPAPAAQKRKPKKNVPVSWVDSHRYYGKWRIVSGSIVATFRTKNHLMLHFHADAKKYFTVFIPRRSLKRFPKKPEEYYLNKDVLVYGKIRRRDRRPVIYLTRRSYIWVVGEALRD